MGCVLACLILWFLHSALGFHQWYVGMCYSAALIFVLGDRLFPSGYLLWFISVSVSCMVMVIVGWGGSNETLADFDN